MYGRIENKAHPFHGLDFIHVGCRRRAAGKSSRFAAFVPRSSSRARSRSDGRRARALEGASGLEPYDCLSPGLMDLIATNTAKARVCSAA